MSASCTGCKFCKSFINCSVCRYWIDEPNSDYGQCSLVNDFLGLETRIQPFQKTVCRNFIYDDKRANAAPAAG